MSNIFELTAKGIDGKEAPLSQYNGKVLLVVNVASRCGYTPQYKGLQALYEKYKDKGFVVLGFPCNQFGEQEPGSEKDIQEFCEINFRVTFPLFAKIKVNGPDADPIYKFLKESRPGFLGTEAIKWNFTKFLKNRQGFPVKRYGSVDTPEAITKDIEKLL